MSIKARYEVCYDLADDAVVVGNTKKQSKDLVISQEINISVKNLFLTAFTFMALGSCTEE